MGLPFLWMLPSSLPVISMIRGCQIYGSSRSSILPWLLFFNGPARDHSFFVGRPLLSVMNDSAVLNVFDMLFLAVDGLHFFHCFFLLFFILASDTRFLQDSRCQEDLAITLHLHKTLVFLKRRSVWT